MVNTARTNPLHSLKDYVGMSRTRGNVAREKGISPQFLQKLVRRIAMWQAGSKPRTELLDLCYVDPLVPIIPPVGL